MERNDENKNIFNKQNHLAAAVERAGDTHPLTVMGEQDQHPKERNWKIFCSGKLAIIVYWRYIVEVELGVREGWGASDAGRLKIQQNLISRTGNDNTMFGKFNWCHSGRAISRRKDDANVNCIPNRSRRYEPVLLVISSQPMMVEWDANVVVEIKFTFISEQIHRNWNWIAVC